MIGKFFAAAAVVPAVILMSIPAVSAPVAAQTASVNDIKDSMSFPATDDPVALGLAFDTLTGELISTSRTCIEGFQPRAGTGPTFIMRLVEVTDEYSLMKSLDISVEGSGSVWAAKVSGKAGFVSQVDMTQKAQNFSFYARADEVAESVADADSDGVRLTPAALAKANESEAAFRAFCGDGFVTQISKGAEAFGVLAFAETDVKKRQEISAAMNASGVSWSASASADAKVQSYSSSSNLKIFYQQRGGSDAPAADWNAIKKAGSEVPARARGDAAIQTVFLVVPYSDGTVSNWAGTLTPGPDIERLVYYRGAYETLLKSIDAIFTDRDTAALHYLLGRGTDLDKLSELRQQVYDNRKKAINLLDSCRSWKVDNRPAGCGSTQALMSSMESGADALIDPYIFLAQLPVGFDTEKPVEYFLSEADLQKAIFDRNLRTVSDSACRFAGSLGEHPACLSDAKLKPFEKAIMIEAGPWPQDTPVVMQTRALKTANCMSTHGEKASTLSACNLSTPSSSGQRLIWLADRRLRVNSKLCQAGATTAGGGTSGHACNLDENVQLWRAVEIDGAERRADRLSRVLLQDANGMCLSGTATGSKVTSEACTPTDAQRWDIVKVK